MKASLSERATPALAALALVGTLGLAGAALAQNAMPPAAGPAQQNMGTAGRGAAASAPASPAAMVQEQNERLHAQLRIMPAQEQAWNQFAEVSRVNAEHLEQLYQDRSTHFTSMNALDNLKNYQEIARAHADDLGKQVDAFQALYVALSPEQKQTLDQLFSYKEERRTTTAAPR